MRLPIVIRAETKYSVGVAMFATAAALYLLTNHIHLVPPRELPLTWVDRAMPFVPATFWIYVSDYLFFTSAYFAAKDRDHLNRYFYAFSALQLVSCLIFVAWPTTYPRGGFPITSRVDPVTSYVFSSLRVMDSPANCCPSLHVSTAFLTAFLFIGENRKDFALFMAWAIAIAVSTLTTKQHYLVDVVSGVTLAVVDYCVFFKLARVQRPEGAQAKR